MGTAPYRVRRRNRTCVRGNEYWHCYITAIVLNVLEPETYPYAGKIRDKPLEPSGLMGVLRGVKTSTDLPIFGTAVKALPPHVEPKYQAIMDDLAASIEYLYVVMGEACKKHNIQPGHISLYGHNMCIEALVKQLSLCKAMYEMPRYLVSMP